jgi:16S rRNA (cytosine967-C5)-methyltransferase
VKHSLALALRDAAGIVSRVAQGRSLSDELDRGKQTEGASGAAALIDLTHGTLRRYGRVQCLVRQLSHRASGDGIVESLLWCALYALESGRYAEYTVVDQAVRACSLLEKWNAKGYVNAALRGYVRRKADLEAAVARDEEARYQHPRWWIAAVRRAHPGEWQATLQAANDHPPMCLRINRRRTTVAAYASRLAELGIGTKAIGADGLLLERPVPVARLPGFESGDASVQDAGAQAAAEFLDLRDGMRVLDACAAPGGKTGQILERARVDLTALDADEARLGRVRSNLQRLGLEARLRVADCTRPQTWWDGKAFERILADVPCTASGVARRHPDIKWLRRETDIAAFAVRQGRILDALWPALAPGGKLLYVTCSVFPQENDEVVDAFLGRTQDARRLPLPDAAATQRLPDAEHDGFFYALITRRA